MQLILSKYLITAKHSLQSRKTAISKQNVTKQTTVQPQEPE